VVQRPSTSLRTNGVGIDPLGARSLPIFVDLTGGIRFRAGAIGNDRDPTKMVVTIKVLVLREAAAGLRIRSRHGRSAP